MYEGTHRSRHFRPDGTRRNSPYFSLLSDESVRHEVPIGTRVPAAESGNHRRVIVLGGAADLWASVQSEDLADVPRFGDAFELAETDVREGDA